MVRNGTSVGVRSISTARLELDVRTEATGDIREMKRLQLRRP